MNEANRVPPGDPEGAAEVTPTPTDRPDAAERESAGRGGMPGGAKPPGSEPTDSGSAGSGRADSGLVDSGSAVFEPAGSESAVFERTGSGLEGSEAMDSESTGSEPTDSESVGSGRADSGSASSGLVGSGSADFELARPVPAAEPARTPEAETAGPESAEAESAGAGEAAVVSDGDFELAKPVPGPTGGAESAAADVSSEPGGTGWAAPAERPKPLHDPDPYGTPPYGEPGPWAPAPPVQHPAATPAQGSTPTPTQTAPPTQGPVASAPGIPAPVPGPHTLGAPGAPAPGTPLGALSSPQPVGDSARRYDPWAAGSPVEQVGALQQSGGEGPADGRRGRWTQRSVVVWSLVIALVSAGIGGVVGAYVEREGLGGDVRLPQAGRVPAGRAPDSVAGIAARALPSVVTLHVTGTDQEDTGTGFVLDAQGHILTNNHVVAPAGSDGAITVTFSSGDTVKAAVVGHDSGYDLAVVQVHGVDGLTPLPLGNSDDVRVGDPVVAIGAPFNLANTVTSGIISAKERPITSGGDKGDGSDVSYVDALQTDAPINPGNSGGPLLDSRAQVIGINSAIRSADSGSGSDGSEAGSIGLGFAIPVNQAKRVAEELINDGHATHPVIGVTLDMSYTGDGARIDSKSANGGPAVTRGGPGEQAGLKAGDVITEVDGQSVHTAEELIVKIRAHRPGDSLRLTVRRGGADQQVMLRLGAAEQN
ncbi:trypsin-like peptidase domain-containing protein [Streptomyces sp. CG1]|uniref:trypsin-like peptidase domain-containing protein n=1 Tax=Streptomyces sp. CG1 TaxID=1287523 RepID=UPI0034E28F49